MSPEAERVMPYEEEMHASLPEQELEVADTAEFPAEPEKREISEAGRREWFEGKVAKPLQAEAIPEAAFAAAGIVGRADYEADMARVNAFKNSPEYIKSQDYEARIIEFVLQKMFADGILGSSVEHVTKTGRFDDMNRGIDFYADLGKERWSVLLGIDATVSNDLRVLAKKVERNFNAATRGIMPSVKYYMNVDGEMKTEKFMPRVILGLDRETTLRMRDALMDDPESLWEDEAVKRLTAQMFSQLHESFLLSAHYPKSQERYAAALRQVDALCAEKGWVPEELVQEFKEDDLVSVRKLVSRFEKPATRGPRNYGGGNAQARA